MRDCTEEWCLCVIGMKVINIENVGSVGSSVSTTGGFDDPFFSGQPESKFTVSVVDR